MVTFFFKNQGMWVSMRLQLCNHQKKGVFGDGDRDLGPWEAEKQTW